MVDPSAPAQVHILLVEDNIGDAVLTKEALKDTQLSMSFEHVLDGVEALAYLHKEAPYNDATLPHLILLDLNMPRMGGLEFLRIVKAEAILKRIPVVILTTSDAESDIEQSYDLQASSYIKKPVDFDEFQQFVSKFHQYWFETVRLPKPPA